MFFFNSKRCFTLKSEMIYYSKNFIFILTLSYLPSSQLCKNLFMNLAKFCRFSATMMSICYKCCQQGVRDMIVTTKAKDVSPSQQQTHYTEQDTKKWLKYSLINYFLWNATINKLFNITLALVDSFIQLTWKSWSCLQWQDLQTFSQTLQTLLQMLFCWFSVSFQFDSPQYQQHCVILIQDHSSSTREARLKNIQWWQHFFTQLLLPLQLLLTQIMQFISLWSDTE